jgi:hypothetical protein
MPKSYSGDLRAHEMEAVEAGKNTSNSEFTLRRQPCLGLQNAHFVVSTDAVKGQPFGGYKPSRLEPYETAINVAVSGAQSMALYELID